MRMMRKEQYGLVWEFLLPWKTSIPVCNKSKVSNSPSVWVSIRDWSLWGQWVEKGGMKAWQGQVVLLTGDAGIGKSRLVQMLKDHVTQEPHTRWECRSAEYYQNTALFPLTDLFQRLLRFQAEETPDEKFGKLEHALSQY